MKEAGAEHRERAGAVEEVLASVSTGKKTPGRPQIFGVKRRLFQGQEEGNAPSPHHTHTCTNTHEIN